MHVINMITEDFFCNVLDIIFQVDQALTVGIVATAIAVVGGLLHEFFFKDDD